ncbi:polysaccharide pyruvyl transferase family protein [Desulfobacter latus]|uniref:Polysaccharide pyruvyl transferase family protein n=1 Tax=Desulfobacter latus TaxID=2292 RepID=A0A850SY06_9BACT|nr:polysaccharide pyruvyl transferase family protein [Desulfobacter latus]NWH05030.1 polysaccharide pyruvyl transferase family protein [Desulfobacter latus]
MKIGIVTFQASPNYGAVLQAFALQTYLKSLGHQPFFIRWNRYENEPSQNGPSQTVRKRSISIPYHLRKPVQKIYGRVLRRTFKAFTDQYLISSKEEYPTADSLFANPPQAEAYICGSDQIWNPRYVSNLSQPIAWLCFGQEQRKISYAGSFGRTHVPESLIQKWKEYASGLYAVSVREENGIEIMSNLGRQDAQWVPDPTLLLQPDGYDPFVTNLTRRNDRYLFSYIIKAGNDNSVLYDQCRKAIRKIRGLDIWECAPNYTPFRSLLVGRIPTPNEWVNKLYHADFVITNSFHGVMLSLLFHRPFIVVLRGEGGEGLNSRIKSILNVAGLLDRAISDFDAEQIDVLCDNDVDWQRVDNRLAIFREKGQRFLQTALSY